MPVSHGSSTCLIDDSRLSTSAFHSASSCLLTYVDAIPLLPPSAFSRASIGPVCRPSPTAIDVGCRPAAAWATAWRPSGAVAWRPSGKVYHTTSRKRPAPVGAAAVDPPWPSLVGAAAVGPPSPSLVGVPDRVMTIGGHSGIGVPFWMIDRIIRPAPDLIRPLTLIIDTRTVVRPGLLSQLSNAELGSLIRRAANVMMRGDPINWIPDAGDLDIFLSESSLGWTLVVEPLPTPEHRRSTSASGRLMLEH